MLQSDVELIKKIKHEVLVLHGQKDAVVPVGVAHQLGVLLANSDVHVYGNCGHWVQIEREKSFNRMVTGFFKNGLD